MEWRGQQAGAFGAPRMSDLVERFRQVLASKSAIRIRGAGTWMNAGRPVGPATTFSIADHRGIVEYVPGDLTLTARAGTALADIAAATKAHDQWLPLDPWGGDEGTIGATVSTGTAGPHAHSMGLPRDAVLGLECLTGNGGVVRAGGRVVKNVAGFDLTRLMTGSWGTLGLITEVSVRLRARPAVTKTFCYSPNADAGELSALALKLRALPFVPLAGELLNDVLAKSLGLGHNAVMLLRVGGNARSVAAQQDVLRSLGALEECSEDAWTRLREQPSAAASWRLSGLPSDFGKTWSGAIMTVAGDSNALIHANPARGVVRVLRANGSPTMPAGDMTLIVEALGESAWASHKPTGGETLSTRIRNRFDPNGLMNPGILGATA
jgi:glycolate oxidase FAD binding subunit